MAKPASQMLIKTIDTTELLHCGSVKIAAATELHQARLLLYIHGALAGSERLRMQIFHDLALTELKTESAWANLREVGSDGTGWFGQVPFTFPRGWLQAAQHYHLAVETDGYTRDGDAFYLGVPYDWPRPVNVRDSLSGEIRVLALAFELYGYRSVAVP